MHQGDIVIAGYDVPQGREPLIHSLYLDCVWQGVSEVLEFLVCGGVGDQQPVSVAHAHAAYYPTATQRGVYNWNGISQLPFKNTA